MQTETLKHEPIQQEPITREYSDFDIAIIGMAGRFPGADSVDEFWRNLCAGKESITFFSDEELERAGVPPQTYSKSNYVKAAPVLNNPGHFDAPFFGYSPREAAATDPQHRLFLECAWEALESAGYDSDRIKVPVGVFGGAAMNTYLLHSGLLPEFSSDYLPTLIGNDNSFLATRVSYKLNLTGPSITVQTACSSSLVAVHTACQSLLSRECDMALAGGTAVRVPHHAGHLYQEYSVFTPDGHCRTFDANAQGTIFGSGVGLIVLKRLEEAMADQDIIYAIVKGSAINNDGSSKVDYTAPSVNSQSHVIVEAMASADVMSDTISYVEAHGTGTNLGDPIELSALTKAFRKHTDKKQFCAIGSVKSNIGHLDAAAGIAGLIKTVMALKDKKIPASLHYETPNPQIDFANSPFFVNTALREWTSTEHPRRAGISSLGIGGTNAHIILEEAPYSEQHKEVSLDEAKNPQVLILSARSEAALEAYAVNLADNLEKQPKINLDDVAYTLREGRKQFEYRRTIVCTSTKDAILHLTDLDSKQSQRGIATVKSKEIVFMFPGQGAQYVDMGRELYDREDVFRNAVSRCAEKFNQYLGSDLRTHLYPPTEQDSVVIQTKEQTVLNETAWAQPAIFSIEYAMAQLLLSWGVRPTLVVGHSIGEYAAACIAGVFTLEDAVKLVAARGSLMQSVAPGAMLAVRCSLNDVEHFLNEDLAIAAINSADRTVVAGTFTAIEELESKLESVGIVSQKLHTLHAFHSPMMEPILDEFMQLASTVQFAPAQVKFVSTVLGGISQNDEYRQASYWVKNIRQTVRFADVATELLGNPARIYVEVGPGTTLSTFIRQHKLKEKQQVVLPSMRHPQDTNSDVKHLLGTIGRLWTDGLEIDWATIYTGQGKRVSLPTYPFQRKEHWYQAKKSSTLAQSITQFTQQRLSFEKWFSVPSWKRTSSPNSMTSNQASKWLIFVDSAGIGERLERLLPNSSGSCVKVYKGSNFEQHSANEFRLNPDNAADYEQILSYLADTNQYPTKIVHLWTIANVASFVRPRVVDKAIGLSGFQSLFFLAKAIGIVSKSKAKQNSKIQLAVISNLLHEIIGNETLYPENALILGPCRAIGKEYPQVECTNFDLALNIDEGKNDALADELLRPLVCELTQPIYHEKIVAYRGRHRWIEVFDAVQLSAADLIAEPATFVENGVYLITGGLGGVGYALAEFLATSVHAKLALIGRSSLPERSNWDSWLNEHELTDPTAQKIRNLLHLEACGATVLPVSVDVTDESHMSAAVAQIEEALGVVRGVIHAAGIVDDGLIQRKEMFAVQQVLEAKVSGTLVLHSVLQNVNLDFFVLCSSVNSILAPAGQVDYAAGNAFLDHFAHYNTSTASVNTISINWPGWQDVGILARMADSPWKQNALKEAISTSEGIKAFERIVASKLPQVIVSPVRFQRESIPVDEFTAAFDSINKRNGIASISGAEDTNTSAPEEFSARSATLQNGAQNPTVDTAERLVADVWKECLGVETVAPDDDFFELGGSSLLAVHMFSKIEEATGQNFPISTLYQASTARQLALLLHDHVTEYASPEHLATDYAIPDSLGNDETIVATELSTVKTALVSTASNATVATLRSIIPIRISGDKTPLFLMHAAGGNVLMYRALAKYLGEEQPLYGLQSLGLADGGSIHKTIEEMALYYADEIIATQPDGPYLLGGFCMGGAIALEAAQILQKMGKEVKCVLLLDSFNVASIENERPFISYCYISLQLARYHWQNFWQIDQTQRREYARTLLTSAMARARLTLRMLKPNGAGQVAKEADENRLQNMQLTDVWQANEDAGRSYQPDKFKGKVVLFKQYARYGYSAALGWETVTEKGVEIKYFPAYPEVFLNEPYVETLAQSVKEYLE